MSSDRVIADGIKAAQHLLRESLPPTHNLTGVEFAFGADGANLSRAVQLRKSAAAHPITFWTRASAREGRPLLDCWSDAKKASPKYVHLALSTMNGWHPLQ
jgi:hypothetical protein